ncbi:MAG: carboxypeptidase-like regulatory domain-containing protein, partial [Fidelibacterota bacterium]
MKRILQFAVILLVPLLLFSQETGKIAGTVTDEATGQPLAGANVLVEGTSFGAATDAEGGYIILGVPVGAYTVRSEFIGYRPMRISNVRVSSRLTTTADFALSSEALELGVVDVVAERPLINPSATNAQRVISSDQIANLASRNVSDFFDLQAGVSFQSNQLHVRGSRPDEVGFEIEGASTSSIIGGEGNNIFQAGGLAPSLQSGGTNTFNL